MSCVFRVRVASKTHHVRRRLQTQQRPPNAALRLADRDRWRLLRGAHAHPCGHGARQGAHHLCASARLALSYGRDPGIATLTNLDVEWDAAEVLELVALGETLATATAE